jgi:hypothetical protein
MLLKGLVYQTMPQATMIAAVAAEMRESHAHSCRLQDVREYLKTQIAIEKGNLKIGKLIIEEMGRQKACHEVRVGLRSFEATTISLNKKAWKARQEGKTSDYFTERKNVLMEGLFKPLIGQTVGETYGQGVVTGLEMSGNSPTFRTICIRFKSWSFSLAHLLHQTSAQVTYVVSPSESGHRRYDAHEKIRSLIGLAVTSGRTVSFDHQTCRVIVDGEAITPMDLGARFDGWKLQTVTVERKGVLLP